MTPRLISIEEGWPITGGPPREEIFDALRLFNERRKVDFTLQDTTGERDPWQNLYSYTLKAIVQGIALEDGSGHSWMLTVTFEEPDEQLLLASNGPFQLYYNDNRRNGRVSSFA